MRSGVAFVAMRIVRTSDARAGVSGFVVTTLWAEGTGEIFIGIPYAACAIGAFGAAWGGGGAALGPPGAPAWTGGIIAFWSVSTWR